MQKVACLFSFKMSSWQSCQKIVFNLHKAYQLNKNLDLTNYNYSVDQLPSDWTRTAEAMAAQNPDIIIVLDHRPHPLPILEQVFQLMEKKPRVVFHVYGDFTLNYPQWDKLALLLEGYQVDFIVASERQKHLIDKFLKGNLTSLVCPFPVDEEEFFYQPNLRLPQRKTWNLKEEDIAFVFTGRLSRQKRIHSLLKYFSRALEETKSQNAHLYLYGSPDHVGDPFVGKWDSENEYFRKINRLYRSLPQDVQKRIHFMGNIPNSELQSVYHGADVLVNLSVHNDEDFGMSVAEAQSCGLPAILTDWGGLAGFYHEALPEGTQYINVEIGRRNKLIDSEAATKALGLAMKNKKFQKRKELAHLASKRLGIQKAATHLEKILSQRPPTFTGLSAFFHEVLSQTLFSPTPYLNPSTRELNSLYKNIYSSYVRHH